jgi:hypothetical protein
MRNKFEQNVCNALKVRECQKFAPRKGKFSTRFSTDSVETFGTGDCMRFRATGLSAEGIHRPFRVVSSTLVLGGSVNINRPRRAVWQ